MDHPELRKIRISPFFPVAGSPDRVVPFMSVGCRRFVPGPNDVLSESYEAPDGDIISLEFPPFACVSIRLMLIQDIDSLTIQSYA